MELRRKWEQKIENGRENKNEERLRVKEHEKEKEREGRMKTNWSEGVGIGVKEKAWDLWRKSECKRMEASEMKKTVKEKGREWKSEIKSKLVKEKA